uniref:SAP domain-containing protein n=1 Tax=Macrostomum lignano TaxID=282301 RepID=A0A1I8G0Z9_9PLAT
KKPGERTVDKHGNVFEYVKDPLTGKVYKKQINKDAKEKGAFKTKGGKIITAADVKRRQDLKQGKRNVDSESEYSYKSEVSDGGTRHVYRRVKKADGTYGDRESYHSSEDEEGQARRRRRRRERKHGNDSAKSFFSDVSEGGTRRVFVRERKPDGTYGEAKEYHSDDSDDFQQAAKAIKQQQKKAKERQHGSDSEHSYVSEYSENGTRTRKRRQRIRDEFGNVIGYGKEVEYESPQASDSDEGGGGGGGQGRKGGGKKGKQAGKGQKGPDGQDVVGGSDSEHSYVSEVSEHGTRHIMRRERIRDADGNVIGYGKKEEYTGKRPVLGHGADGKKSRKKRDETGEEYEVYSDTSEGGTKRTMRRKVIRDELGNVIGHGEEELRHRIGRQRRQNPQAEHGQSGQRERVRRAEQKAAEAAAAGGDKKKRKGKTVRLANGVEVHVSSDSEVFSDASTDSEVVREQLANMTEEERQEFLRDRAARQQARENRRKEKYGAEYSKMTEKNARKKEERKRRLEELQEEAMSALAGGGGGAQGKEKSSPKKSPAKSMVVYDNKGNRFKDLPPDDRGIGLGHNDWGQPEKGRRKLKDGNEADSESDYEPGTERRKRDKKRPGSTGSSDSDSGAEIIRGKDGKILKKVKKDKDGNVVELEYDDKGNVVKRTVRQADEDQGDYFEKGSDGKIRLKKGKKRLDLDKISRDELRALGIDPNASKAEIMRQLKQKLGGDVDIDFLSAYRLVDPNKLETYGKAFVVEDFDDMDGLINVRCAKRAISMVPSVAGLSERQIDYALQVLGFDGNTQLTFRMFSVAMALCERVTKMDQFCRDLLEITNLIDIERKLALYRAMFYCNIPSDRDPNYIKLDSLRIELMAGGLNWRQQEFIIDKLQPNEMHLIVHTLYNLLQISFLDYLCYIPLFLSFHDNILSNPLDMSDLKYTPTYRRRASAQRDMNPLAFPLKKNTKFMRDHAVGTLMEGKPLDSVVRKDNEKVQKAFDRKEGSISYPASAKGQSKDKD